MIRDIENPLVIESYWRVRKNLEDIYEFENDDAGEPEVICAVCGYHDIPSEMVESEKWEDYYLCGDKICNDQHYLGWSESMEQQKYYLK